MRRDTTGVPGDRECVIRTLPGVEREAAAIRTRSTVDRERHLVFSVSLPEQETVLARCELRYARCAADLSRPNSVPQMHFRTGFRPRISFVVMPVIRHALPDLGKGPHDNAAAVF